MQYTERLGLRKPDQSDHYNVDDFNYNYQKISEAFTGVPVKTDYVTLDEFITSEQVENIKKGDAIIINSVIYVLIGDDPLNKDDYVPYGADGMVIMREYIPTSKRIKGSMYLQVGKTRRLIIKIFTKFFNREPNAVDAAETMLFKETTEMTDNTESDMNHRFTCKNMNILDAGETVERKEQKFYFIK